RAGVGDDGRAARRDDHVLVVLVAAVLGGAVVGVAAVVGDPVVGDRLGDVYGRRDVAAVPLVDRRREVAADLRLAGGVAEQRGRDRAADVGRAARERRRVGQVGAVDAEHDVRAGVGDDGRAARRDDDVLVVAVAAVRGRVVVGVAAVVGDPVV